MTLTWAAARLAAPVSTRLAGSAAALLATDRLLEGRTSPTLVLHDEDDIEVPLADAALLTGALEHCDLVRTSGLGHRAIVRDPHVVELVTGFVGSSARARIEPAELTSS